MRDKDRSAVFPDRPALDEPFFEVPRLRGHAALTILDGDRVLATPGFLARCPGGSLAASLAG